MCSTAFTTGSVLSAPVDAYYRLVTVSFVATASVNTLQFSLSDSSTSSHLYWIKDINIKLIQVFDPVSRQNYPSCPINSFLTTNTQPFACQSCGISGKVVNEAGNGCSCPINTYLYANNICKSCHYSCKTCSSTNPTTQCLSCPLTRSLATLCVCNLGTF